MSLIAELKRRNVIRVLIAYIAASWLLIQVSETLLPVYGFGDAAIRIVVGVLAVGFIPALVFSWLFELTPDGLKKESEVDRSRSTTSDADKKLDRAIIVVLGLALVYFAFDKLVLSESRIESALEQGRAQGIVQSYGRKSIAVLPFVDMSSDGTQEYMSDGIAEELLNLLARFDELRVISRSSAFAFKGKDISIREIAKQLNVAHILEGSVRKSGNRIRITAQLIDARTDTHLWSETYDRDLDDIFAIQDEVSVKVVRELKIALLGAAPKSSVTDPDAYLLFLQARFLAEHRTEDGLQRAIALYGRVLDIDPNYVPAWVWMAAAHNDLAPFTAGPDQAMHSQLFRDYIEKALVIDPDNAVALAVSSAMSAQDGDIETAVAKMKLALRIAPNDLQVIRTSIFPLMYLGKWDQVVKVLEYAFDRDPLSLVSRINLVLTYGGVGNYEQAIELAEQSLAMNSDDLNARYILGIATIQTGDAEAGLRISEDIPLPFLRHKIATLAYHALGDMQSYESGIDAMRQLVIDGAEFASHGALAEAYAMTGNFDAAFAELDKSMENGEPPVFFDYPIFWGMFDDPRWDELMTRSGMPREKIEAIDFDVVLPDK